MTTSVGVIIGSISSTSINRRLAHALEGIAPASLALTEIPIAELPMYSSDFDADFPAVARDFKEAVRGSDALLIVTPEYNRSIPGVLKNAIDWASRPYGDGAFGGIPTGVIGASTGKIGTAVGQGHLRGVLAFVNAIDMTQPEGYVQLAPSDIAEDGTIANESMRDFLTGWMEAFAAFVERYAKR